MVNLKIDQTEILRVWKDVMLPIVGHDKFEDERVASAISAIRSIISHGRENGSNIEAASNILMISRIWRLITNEIMEGFNVLIEQAAKELKASLKGQSLNLDQIRLCSYMLASVKCGEDLNRFGLVSVVMPFDLAERVHSALEALVEGEINEIFAPTKLGRHNRPYSWDKARLLACEHVLFLVGKGKKKGIARKEVALATSIKTETLRAWERELSQDLVCNFALQVAHDAGKFESNSEFEASCFTKVSIKTACKKLKGAALIKFGKHYQTQFGERHW